mmetsp:Transcript_6903/g.22926  ORF Transcript_6903/g.22926 Transcript_6903/m.22926 type:complete len:258 (+) Transcript_6903:1309-2082(+)
MKMLMTSAATFARRTWRGTSTSRSGGAAHETVGSGKGDEDEADGAEHVTATLRARSGDGVETVAETRVGAGAGGGGGGGGGATAAAAAGMLGACIIAGCIIPAYAACCCWYLSRPLFWMADLDGVMRRFCDPNGWPSSASAAVVASAVPNSTHPKRGVEKPSPETRTAVTSPHTLKYACRCCSFATGSTLAMWIVRCTRSGSCTARGTPVVLMPIPPPPPPLPVFAMLTRSVRSPSCSPFSITAVCDIIGSANSTNA